YVRFAERQRNVLSNKLLLITLGVFLDPQCRPCGETCACPADQSPYTAVGIREAVSSVTECGDWNGRRVLELLGEEARRTRTPAKSKQSVGADCKVEFKPLRLMKIV